MVFPKGNDLQMVCFPGVNWGAYLVNLQPWMNNQPQQSEDRWQEQKIGRSRVGSHACLVVGAFSVT